MTRTVDIPGGQAVLRDPDDLTERHRRTIRTLIFSTAVDVLGDDPDVDNPKMHLTADTATRMFAVTDASIVTSLVSWTLDLPLPTIDTVQDLPGGLYDTLANETAALVSKMTADFSPTPDPQSPTPPSSGSSGLLRAEEPSTPTPLNGGGNTSTGSSITSPTASTSTSPV